MPRSSTVSLFLVGLSLLVPAQASWANPGLCPVIQCRAETIEAGPYSAGGIGDVVQGYVDDGSTLDEIAAEMFKP